MKILIALALCVCICSATTQIQTKPIKTYKIDLDKEPRDRFVQIAKEHRIEILGMLPEFLRYMPDILRLVFSYMNQMIWWMQTERYEEMQGIAEAVGAPFEDILALNYVYEMTAVCTSVIFRAINGTLFHGRNLDMPVSAFLRNITFEAEWYKGGKLIFKSTQFAGQVGVFTGMRIDGFTVSENTRNRFELWRFAKNFVGIILGTDQVSWSIRDTLVQCKDYDCAMWKLQKAYTVQAGYITLAGMKDNQGAVITKDRLHLAHVEELDDFKWFIAQTNTDHFLINEDEKCDRYDKVNEVMINITQQNMVLADLANKVLDVQPIMNYRTVYTSIMSSATGMHESVVDRPPEWYY